MRKNSQQKTLREAATGGLEKINESEESKSKAELPQQTSIYTLQGRDYVNEVRERFRGNVNYSPSPTNRVNSLDAKSSKKNKLLHPLANDLMQMNVIEKNKFLADRKALIKAKEEKRGLNVATK